MNFKNKAVLITGGWTGIGKAAAVAFAKAGAFVAINGSSAGGEQAVDELLKFAGKAIYLRGDVSDVKTCRELIKQTVKEFGRLDILVNNAGIVPVGTVSDIDEETWDRAMDVNAKGTFFLSKYAVEQMRKQGGGVIVNTGSVAGMIGPKNRAAYSATKGAVISLTRAMAADHVRENIRVNCVCPGMTVSDSLEKRISEAPDPQKAREDFCKSIPMGRMAAPDEIAQAILFSACDEGSFMTGSVILMDGGASL